MVKLVKRESTTIGSLTTLDLDHSRAAQKLEESLRYPEQRRTLPLCPVG